MVEEMTRTLVFGAALAITAGAQAQAPASAPSPAKKAAPAAKKNLASPVATAASVTDKLVQLIKMKMPDPAILKAAGNAGASFGPDDLIKLKEAGASDALLVSLTAGAAPAAAVPAAGTTRAAPAAAPAAYNTDLASLNCQVPAGQRKRVIALKNFEYGAVKTADQAILNTQANIGKGMTALAVKRIQEAGKYRVVERENIQSVLAEQDFGASARVKKGTQSKVGNILGADAILLGTITVFGRDDKKKSAGGIAGMPGGLGGLKFKWGEDKAVVAVSYRLVDAETSETLWSGEARGESKRKSKGLDLGAFGGGGGGAGGFDMTSSNFAQTIIGEATIECMDKLMENLNTNEAKIPLRNIEIDTRVADISGAQVYISSGSSDGVQKCDRYEVSRIVKEIRDPVTKDLLDLQLEKVGDLVVTEVRERMAIAAFNGTSAPQVGYAVRKVMPAAK
jgi:curli biogenesis system outer membrane secretion channel CsgG